MRSTREDLDLVVAGGELGALRDVALPSHL